MSTQNDNTLPKIWQIIDIVYHIVRLSETVAAIALARTCKRLYSCIISSNSLWHKLYRHNFPRDINTDIDWLEWQLEQEQRVTVATTINAKSKVESRLTWFQLYSQRVNMGINWQKNKPTSTVHLKPFSVIEIAELTNFAQTIVISYPGWFAIAALWKLQVDLIKLLPMNESKTYSLDLDKSRFKWIKNIKFYQHRHQANNSDKYMRVILHLEYVEESFNALQIWNANSCELLHSIDIYGDWDGRTINASLLFLNSKLIGLSNNPQFRCYTRLVYNIDSEKQPREYQSIILKNPINFFKNIIHTTSNDETIIIRYRNNKRKVAYQVIRVLLPPDANLVMIDDNTVQTTTIASDYIRFSNPTVRRISEVYSVDCDRILVHCHACLIGDTSNRNMIKYQRYIRVISLSTGVVFECNYLASKDEKLILISTYNLAVFGSSNHSSLVVISLLDGKILHEINIMNFANNFCSFQHIIDSKIIGYNYTIGRYCVINAVTGSVNAHRFPISEVQYCTSAFGHMLLANKETTLITSFVPELI